MTGCYFDSSVVLRYVLNQPEQLRLNRLECEALTSEITAVECRRVLDRLRLQGVSDADALLLRHESLARFLAGVLMQPLGRAVLLRAAEPLEVPLGTLDAIHLATALRWREEREQTLAFATHDRTLARAARLYGLEVLGV